MRAERGGGERRAERVGGKGRKEEGSEELSYKFNSMS